MSDPFGAAGEAGGAVDDIFGMFGSFQAANGYSKAANIAWSNEELTKRSGAIEQQQENQTIMQAIGSQTASTAGAGFDVSAGSSGDLLRMSTQKGALNKQLLANQTEITAQGYEQQAQAYKAQEKAANTKAIGQGIGGLLKTGLSLAMMF